MDMLLIIIFVLMGIGVFGYFFLMVFYPEWVGITGSETKRELEQEAREAELREQENKESKIE